MVLRSNQHGHPAGTVLKCGNYDGTLVEIAGTDMWVAGEEVFHLNRTTVLSLIAEHVKVEHVATVKLDLPPFMATEDRVN
jgi:hypothetical protein